MEKADGIKIDNQLKVALDIPQEMIEKSNINTGYDAETNLWEVIVKYNSDISFLEKELDIFIEILSERYAIITLKKEDIYKLSFYREIEYIEQPRNLKLYINKAVNSICVNPIKQNPYNLDGEGVIVGIIDSGISYMHKDFINDDNTSRILYIWDQTVDGNSPKGFLKGTLYEKQDIDKAISSNNPLEIVSQTDDIGHGTIISGIASGNGRASKGQYVGIAHKSSIIAVKLGEKGRESFARNTEIMRAIKFILDKAIELNMPVAINLSFGTNDGSHSGGSLFETYIDDMSNIWKSVIVVPTGNEGSSAHHFAGEIKQDESMEIEISVGTSITSLYIVMYKNFVDDFDIKIVSPNGEETGYINNTSLNNSYNFENATLFFNMGEPTPYTVEQGVFFEIIPKNEFLSNGIWKIVIKGNAIVSGKFNIWLPVVETVSKDTKFLKPTINTTLTIPSTANNVICVGGYNSFIDSIADFSGRGYSVDNRIKPDIVAPAVNIVSTSNTLGYDSSSGTSLAAPFVTGACALLMQWGIVQKNDLFLYGQRIKAFLRAGAKRKNILKYPNEEWGYGSLCLLETIKLLNKYKKISIQDIEKETEKSQIDLENFAYSEDYIEVVAQYNIYTEEIMQKYDFIKVCKKILGEYVVLFIPKDKIKLLTDEEIGKMSLQMPFCLGLMEKSALESTGVLAIQNQPFLSLKGEGVLVGIVDTGINYNLDEFKYEDNTTKIVSIWDQSIPGKPPKDFCFGTEYTREEIDLALNSENPLDIVKTVDEIGHGTKLASVCCARESKDKDFIGVAPDSELVVVKLKQAKKSLKDYCFIDENIPAYNSSNMLLAIEYLYQKALQEKKPIAICIPLGTNSGLHNGLSIVEKYITNVASRLGVVMNVANGNEADAQHHSLAKLLKTGDEKTLEFNVAEKEEGFLLNIVSYPGDKIAIEIINPLGETTGKILPRDNYDEEIKFPLSNSRVRVQYYSKSYQNSGQFTLARFINPSFGNWKLKLYGEKVLIGDVHCWLPIKNFIKEDTYFLNPEPFYTVTTPATADSILSVGGYNHIENSVFIESGRGPNRLNQVRPMICAPAKNVSCINNFGDLDIITGTSVATAISTGCSALMLEWGIVKNNNPNINSLSMIGYFAYGAEKQPNDVYPNNICGFGRLNIASVFENL